jgi:hypothetical protein
METTTALTSSAANGLNDLMHIAPVVTLLVLIIMGLCWFIRSLLQDARDERKLNRDALTNSTAVIAELKELIRSAIHK